MTEAVEVAEEVAAVDVVVVAATVVVQRPLFRLNDGHRDISIAAGILQIGPS